MVEAAARSFTTVGWIRTTVAAVAAEAGVSEELVVKRVGTKAELLVAALRVRSFDLDTDLAGAVRELRLEDLADPHERVARFVDFAVRVLDGMAPFVPVLRAAADQDAGAAALLRRIHDQRMDTAAYLAGALRGSPATPEQVVELAVLTSAEVHLVWVRDVGAPVEQYAAWLRERLLAVATAPGVGDAAPPRPTSTLDP